MFWLYFLGFFFCHWCSEAAVPNFLAPGTSFMGDSLSTDQGWGWFWDESSILHFFNWKIIILQCCISFCCAKTRTSHVYAYIPSLVSLTSTLPDPIRLGHHRDLSAIAKLPVLYSSFLLPGGTNWEIRINILIYIQPCALHLACALFLVSLYQLLLRSSGIRSRLPYGISEYFHYFNIAFLARDKPVPWILQ